MPEIRPIHAVAFARAFAHTASDISALIAPPYDVLDEGPKKQLLSQDPANIVAVDLPFTPPKVVGPDAVYQQAGELYRSWLSQGVLAKRPKPAVYVYRQSYTHRGREMHRSGLIACVKLQEFGPTPVANAKSAGGKEEGNLGGGGGVWPHELTFASGKEDRLKLMRACQAQLSPIFGIYRDPQQRVVGPIQKIMAGGSPSFTGVTATDQVRHSVWEISDPQQIAVLTDPLQTADIYIADGHHRYHTALNHRNELARANGGSLPENHPANDCFFVLVAMEDPGMIVLPTHRVLSGLNGLTLEKLVQAANGLLNIRPFTASGLTELEAALPSSGHHATGLYLPSSKGKFFIATTVDADPLAATHGKQSSAWRQLDVAIVQHLLVERVCQPAFGVAGQPLSWKFPHELEQLAKLAESQAGSLGIVVQPTPLKAVMDVSAAGELMPQKSTFFYPKLATGLVINPLA